MTNNLCLYANDANLNVSAENIDDLKILAYLEMLNIQDFKKITTLYWTR